MKKEIVKISGLSLPVYSLNTIIVGSGAASLNCADHLFSYGQKDLAIVTGLLGGGTSHNAGSDKQTYYKMSVSGKEGDSPYKMAGDLFNGGAMHGDIALIEATLSLQEFYHLVQIGVQFPHNKYGAFVGYKTDYDPLQRATSAGPLTSRQMVQCLLREVSRKGIPILDQHEIIRLLTHDSGGEKRVVGALAIDKNNIKKDNMGLVLFNCDNVVFGVGGPGALYKDSVYPPDQAGSIGLALEIGAKTQNLTESQFGLASVKFRWNLSGTYQQVVPRYFSTNKDGTEPEDFLNKSFPSMGMMATAIFLKGYQWPFDPRKIENHGSSLIDLLVHQETAVKGRRVFMDFTENPRSGHGLGKFRLTELSREAYDYLKKSGALSVRPIARLQRMNPAAIELYKSHNIDITKEPLEIAVCAQHNNGGLTGNIWWESNIKHLFPIGEVNGTHGVYRPGGSALNSGQAGGLRAAQFIAREYTSKPQRAEEFASCVREQIKEKTAYCRYLISNQKPSNACVDEIIDEVQNRMSLYGAHIRKLPDIKKALREAHQLQGCVKDKLGIRAREDIPQALKCIELCLAHVVYLEAIKAYLEQRGGSRGGYMVLSRGRALTGRGPNKTWNYRKDAGILRNKIGEIKIEKGRVVSAWVPVRKIPDEDFWFETVWREYQQDNVTAELNVVK